MERDRETAGGLGTKAWAGVAVVVLAGLAVVAYIKTEPPVAAPASTHPPSGLHDPARVAWKDRAIAEIAARAEDEKWPAAELARIEKQKASPDYYHAWFTDSLIPMENGDWIIYAAECYKSDPRIWDIFIGRGSDGKWYYTTYHFCIGMMELGQTKSLSEFAECYSAREFDGKSDACLERTWPTPTPEF